ncbi:MAG: CocE/NonD family hydrolase [Candidatus Latescibacteria bacterium]|nr:CocE/NonD family hydrolase [Candidatus Latescibacterota bacterium]
MIRRHTLYLATAMLSVLVVSCGLPKPHPGIVSTRDGTPLATDVFLPKESDIQPPYPAILVRTTYNKDAGRAGVTMAQMIAKQYTERGYTLVVQDTRGRFGSAGVDSIFLTDGAGYSRDGYDTIEWITQQPWSDGQVGMWGVSAQAITSYLAAASGHPALKCAWVTMGGSNLYHDIFYPGGVFRSRMVDTWVTGQGRADFLPFIHSHSSYDRHWQGVDITNHASGVRTAFYHTGGWFDCMSVGQTRGFKALHESGGEGAKGQQMLVMGPWSHAGTGRTQGELTFPDNNATIKLNKETFAWFDHHLKGETNTIDSLPPVRYYLMGDVDDSTAPGNVWLSADSWPPAGVKDRSFFFGDNGGLNESASVSKAPDSYSYDPRNPVPTLGGLNLFQPIGPADLTSIETRDDVVSYTTPPLTEPLAVVGPVGVTLWASSSAEDTDFMAMLTDVYPDGRSMLILDGPIRARHRDSFTEETPMSPGQAYEFEIDLWETALVFNKGHRIRVDITSSSSPRFKVNPNAVAAGDTVVAVNTIYHDGARPSSITFAVLPPEATTP